MSGKVSVFSHIGHEAPWRILLVAFWLSIMAKFVKDGNAICRILGSLPSAIGNTGRCRLEVLMNSKTIELAVLSYFYFLCYYFTEQLLFCSSVTQLIHNASTPNRAVPC